LGLIKLLAIFLPHITEEVFHNYYKKHEASPSVHLSRWPEPVFIDAAIEDKGETLKQIISTIREWKSNQGIALNAPLPFVKISSDGYKKIRPLENTIKSTLNITDLKIMADMPHVEEIVMSAKPDYAKIGQRFKERSGDIINNINTKDPQVIAEEIRENDVFSVETVSSDGSSTTISLPGDYVKLKKELRSKGKKIDMLTCEDIKIAVER
jgi:valyl-tRNA synthetase